MHFVNSCIIHSWSFCDGIFSFFFSHFNVLYRWHDLIPLNCPKAYLPTHCTCVSNAMNLALLSANQLQFEYGFSFTIFCFFNLWHFIFLLFKCIFMYIFYCFILVPDPDFYFLKYEIHHENIMAFLKLLLSKH